MFGKILFILPILGCILATIQSKPLPEGEIEMHGKDFEDAVKKLDSTLKQVALIGGPAYEIVEVNNATHQYNDYGGYKLRYTTVLSDESDISRDCKVTINEEPTEVPIEQVTISCDGLKEYNDFVYYYILSK